MQPGYGAAAPGGINQHQQLIDDDGCSSVFTISNLQNQTHHHLFHPQQQQKQQQPQQVFLQPPHSAVPFTHQLFHHQHQAFRVQQQQQLRLEQEPCNVQHPFFNVNFKLGLNESSVNNERVLNQEEDTLLAEQHISGIRQHSSVIPRGWRSQEDSAVKQPFWKHLNRCNNKQCNEDKGEDIECNKNKEYNLAFQQSNDRCSNLDSKYRPFGELEAIYSLPKAVEINQTGSGSVLTGDNSPKNAGILMPLGDTQQMAGANPAVGVDHGSENSIGEEASLGRVEKRKRKRKIKEKLSSMAGFLESLVRQVMDHQESLHRRFLEVIQRLDEERVEREEACRRQEAERYNREAISRAHEQALASNREAVIVSHIEKITGQTINLPPRKTPLLLQPEVTKEATKELTPMKIDSNSRWPKGEVEALIQVRSGLESRFLEPGLKGPLWEEVSSLMTSMGYKRSAKRCKEKWENINKYFRKTKESGKKRSSQSKTCAYFDHLDQLYSRTLINLPSPSNPSFNSDIGLQNQGYSELLEAFASDRNLDSEIFNVSEMGPSSLNFDGNRNQKVGFEQGIHGDEEENSEDNNDSEEENQVEGDEEGD